MSGQLFEEFPESLEELPELLLTPDDPVLWDDEMVSSLTDFPTNGGHLTVCHFCTAHDSLTLPPLSCLQVHYIILAFTCTL